MTGVWLALFGVSPALGLVVVGGSWRDCTQRIAECCVRLEILSLGLSSGWGGGDGKQRLGQQRLAAH